MERSILKEATQRNLDAYLNNRVYNSLYYPDIFPIKKVPSLSFETLVGSKGNRVAADITTYDASAPLKSRKVIKRVTGEIPPIRMKKKMAETDLNDYNIIKAMGNADVNQLLEMVFGDVDACIDGVQGRMEWMALQALSQGSITLTTSNSAGIITEAAIDFGLPSANKEVCGAANYYWTTGAYSTNHPITDIQTIVAEAKAAGSAVKYIHMNSSKFIAFATSTQVQNYVIASSFVGGTAITYVPTLAQVNNALSAHGLPTIIIIDTMVDLETAEHAISSVDPWENSSSEDRYVVFTPDLPLGNFLVGPIAMETNPPKQATIAKKGHILVSKWSTVDPVGEFTMGETNAFPSFALIDQCWNLDTESHTTWGA